MVIKVAAIVAEGEQEEPMEFREPTGPWAAGAASPAEQARCGGPTSLALALQEARARTLALHAAFESALGPDLRVPRTPEFNPPLWELGHVGWFADWWLARHPQHPLGLAAHPDAPRRAARQAQRGVDADALYNSSAVAHATRWQLDLPTAEATRADLAASLHDTLALLRTAPDTDAALYFFRLALFHEDMHTEAATCMAQTLGLGTFAALSHPTSSTPMSDAIPPDTPAALQVPSTLWTLGRSGPGFAFDNELGAHTVPVAAFEVDAHAVTWAQYLPFVEAGGHPAPRHLRRSPRSPSGWAQCRFGCWQDLVLTATACHLNAGEAQAWCQWAGRRLPTEAEWEVAAHTQPGFVWGRVWEWTASPFAPFPGFVPHPYRDYSQPWFDGRPVLKGASPATVPRMRHPRYRNYFPPERNDIFAGFRSVGLAR